MSSSSSNSSASSNSSSSSSASSYPSQASSSSASSSSYTNTNTSSASSSSSQSGVQSSPSQIVLFRVIRGESQTSYVVVVDLSAQDELALQVCGTPRLDPGGVFNGYRVAHQRLPIQDRMRLVLRISPRQDLDDEDRIYQSWLQHVLSQLRAGIRFARQEASILGYHNPTDYRVL